MIEFAQETNSFGPVSTTKEDFDAGVLIYNPYEIFEYNRNDNYFQQVFGFTKTFETIRRSLVKIAVRVSELGTRIKLSFAQSCAYQRDLKWLCQTWVEP